MQRSSSAGPTRRRASALYSEGLSAHGRPMAPRKEPRLVSGEQDQQLIAHWIESHPWKQGVAEARLRDSKIPVWAIVGYLQMVNGDAERTARDYRIPGEAVETVLAYYRRHREAIDARLAANLAVPATAAP